jgi:hypothetical protein
VKNNLGECNNFKALDKVSDICDTNYLAGGLWQHAARFLNQLLHSWLSTFVSARLELGENKHRGINRAMDLVHKRRGGGGGFFLLLESPKFARPTHFIVRVCRSV